MPAINGIDADFSVILVYYCQAGNQFFLMKFSTYCNGKRQSSLTHITNMSCSIVWILIYGIKDGINETLLTSFIFSSPLIWVYFYRMRKKRPAVVLTFEFVKEIPWHGITVYNLFVCVLLKKIGNVFLCLHNLI